MKRPLKPEELRVWSMVAATVHPLPGRSMAKPAPAESFPSPSWGGPTREASGVGKSGPVVAAGGDRHFPTRAAARPVPPHEGEGKAIEPNRRHRIAKEREEIGGRVDLHGMTQDRARAVLEAFLHRAWNERYRAVLVITGKGVQGDGILKKRTPDWLGAPHLAHIVAGISEAHRKHGGEGALYVALKRKPRG
jgi:DNA-nicking Smr family endonuclease